ncbi:MAG TPA: RagB/SusD family nutrient uptake outer membrane protein, partial [Gracilimonas sp.]|uniref:RagB/SusD family nutrient uptake outer membrane protein n=1 Tax=Gracilimonas sp. TaxID=1974203 RepID=UPI002D9F6FB8|nr:RagB/SusD family nutrient uptake outer membrane protein [Gracilimonas sp.]
FNGDGAPGSMFELAYSETDASSFDNLARIYRDTNYGDVEVTNDLYNAYDPADIRLGLYSAEDEDPDDARPLNYRMVGKWTNEQGYDNIAVIRFAEVILNYAEALASQPGGEPAALVELTKITSERNAPAYATGAIANVWNERRLELAMEGHRFFDLIRTGRPIPIVDPAQTIADGGVPAGSYRFAMPIPQDEIDANSSMVQNEGYGD